MDFFFYGTLMDADIRAAVMPSVADRLELRPASVPGWRRVRASHGSYPVLVPHRAGRVDGLLARGFDGPSLLRMAHFEGQRYRPVSIATLVAGRRRAAWVFLPSSSRDAGRQPWTLAAWQRRHKRHLLQRTAHWMGEFGVDEGRGHDVNPLVRRQLLAFAEFLDLRAVRQELRRAA